MRARGVLATTAAAVVLLVGYDTATYAATGSSLLLGRSNKAAATTTVQNTGKGAALALITASSGYPPFTTNAKGKVVNLNADRVDGLTAAQIETAARTGVDAAKLGGQTASQVVAAARAGVDATKLGGLTLTQVEDAALSWWQFTRSAVAGADISVTSGGPVHNAVQSGAITVAPGVRAGQYLVHGTVQFDCDPTAPVGTHYLVTLWGIDNGQAVSGPPNDTLLCGQPVAFNDAVLSDVRRGDVDVRAVRLSQR